MPRVIPPPPSYTVVVVVVVHTGIATVVTVVIVVMIAAWQDGQFCQRRNRNNKLTGTPATETEVTITVTVRVVVGVKKHEQTLLTLAVNAAGLSVQPAAITAKALGWVSLSVTLPRAAQRTHPVASLHAVS